MVSSRQIAGELRLCAPPTLASPGSDEFAAMIPSRKVPCDHSGLVELSGLNAYRSETVLATRTYPFLPIAGGAANPINPWPGFQLNVPFGKTLKISPCELAEYSVPSSPAAR